jgi:transposase
MIDWGTFAQSLNYIGEAEMWKDFYVTKSLSIGDLAKKLDVSRNTVRMRLNACGVTSRNRGGPNNQKLELTDEIVEEIRKDGIAVVAKRLDLSYTTIYKRLYQAKGMSLEELRKLEAAENPEVAP